MKIFEIDASGCDIFNKGYTIAVAEQNNDNGKLAYKFSEKVIQNILAKYGRGEYGYLPSKKGKAYLKVRVYCIAIYYLFKELKLRLRDLREAHLLICRDLYGHEQGIKDNLAQLLVIGLNINVIDINFVTLPNDSIADNFAFLVRLDKRNELIKNCVSISSEDFDRLLKKKK